MGRGERKEKTFDFINLRRERIDGPIVTSIRLQLSEIKPEFHINKSVFCFRRRILTYILSNFIFCLNFFKKDIICIIKMYPSG